MPGAAEVIGELSDAFQALPDVEAERSTSVAEGITRGKSVGATAANAGV